MRKTFLVWGLCAALALTSPLGAQDGVFNPQTDQSQLTRNKGQLPGTTSNDNPCAGCVGEVKYAQSFGSFTATITIATPGVVSGTHSFNGVAAIVFSTTGALPTGLTAGTTYYTSPATVPNGSFNLSTTVDNAIAGTYIATTGSQSGVQTATASVAVTDAGTINVNALSLTAGDWIIWTYAEIGPAISTVVAANTNISISPTSGTLATPASGGAIWRMTPFTSTGQNSSLAAGPLHVQLNSTTTYYGVHRSAFTISTMNFIVGKTVAQRIR